METLYGLKRKTTNRWLKLLLLLFVAVGFGVPNLNAQTKATKVVNDWQLIDALNNPAISSIELAPGNYVYLNVQPTSTSKVIKHQGGGNRSSSGCTYWIFGEPACFNPFNVGLPPGHDPLPGFSFNTAHSGTINATCINPPCCPDPGTGYWSLEEWPAGATVVYYDTTSNDMDFWVDMPGQYLFTYIWNPAVNPVLTEYAEVETEYNFYGPADLELSAPDVCGNTTLLDFDFEPGFDPINPPGTGEIEWFLDAYPYGNPVELDGMPTASVDDFPFTVDCCGLYILTVRHTVSDPFDGCIVEVSDTIEFSCQPIADAGEDANICNDNCYMLIGNTGLDTYDCSTHPFSDNYAYSFVQLDGPYLLNGLPAGSTDQEEEFETEVCRADRNDAEDICPYGEYEVQFQVTNGLCYDADEMDIRFYEMPVAIAGPDQNLCNTFSFSLAAVPFDYCGEEGVNYWSHTWWTLEDQPGECEVAFDEFNPGTLVSISDCDDECAYGQYVFVWHELNVKIEDGDTLWGESHCYASDEVVVTIYEDPQPDAGEDMIFCNTFAFSLNAIADEPCYENTVVVYSWEKSAEPGHCGVEFSNADDPETSVELINCEPCQYGKYIFTFTQSNGYYDENDNFVSVCSTSDDVTVWNFEEPDAEAGIDQHICNSFAFTLEATPTEFCGVAIEPPNADGEGNYNTWGEWSFVSGPAEATFEDANDYTTGVTIDIDDVECPYGAYTFMWTEYNGFMVDGVFEGCVDEDLVTIFIDETPESVNAGEDQEYCETFDFYLDGTLDLPCTQGTAYSYTWELVSQPDNCEVAIQNVSTDPNDVDPLVSIRDCEGCPYGEYVFKLTQLNGYLTATGEFVEVCSASDEVSVWIYQAPEIGELTGPPPLCNTFAFDLSAVGSDYCGYHNNWYSWTLVSQPEDGDCEVTITNGTTTDASVAIGPCTGECPYGEYVFKFTEYDGSEDVYCEDYDLISVFIFEQPIADAGDDIAECVDIATSMYCYDMSANLEFCYSMQGVWTKSCGPGNVEFSDINDPASEVCFDQPGHYVFTWTLSNDACQDADDIIFNLVEQPTASAENTKLVAPCDETCIDLGLAEVDKYVYFGTEEGDCPNFNDMAHWSYVSGPTGNPAEVSFADDADPATELCVSTFGCYTVRWNEWNQLDDQACSDYVDIGIQFVETPEANAGDDVSVCSSCYTMQAVPFIPDYNNCPPSENHSYWTWIDYIPPVPFCDFNIDYSACGVYDPINPNGQFCVCDDYYGSHYGTYVFTWTEINGVCTDVDTVNITLNKTPDDVPISGCINSDNCMNYFQMPVDRDLGNCGCVTCWLPEDDDVMTVCANTCGTFGIDWSCLGQSPIPGYTYEWSFIGPAGSTFDASPYYYDCECGWKGSPNVYLCFGECCDTAILYLTITTPEGCVNTEQWKFYVQHPPDATISGPEVAEIDQVFDYSVPNPENTCYLYTWDVQHCGVIVYGQGTGTIGVQWTDYNENGGWGKIHVVVYDTCTCCCNTDELLVKVYPANTLGDATLAGYVYYHNAGNTPLDGVEIQLWNSNIPVMSTTSFDDIEGGNGVGYFEFPGINGTTNFGVTATYDAPWYGANATDALAVQLKVINALPGGFVEDNVVDKAMDVNNSLAVSATDALWIKQRAINMVNYFPAGDWAFDPTMSASAASSPYIIYALNEGDANRSNVPNSMKSTPAIDLLTDGTLNVVTGQVFELPIRIADANQFGAITLNLEYNSALLQVVDVIPVDGLIDNLTDGNVSIAWSSVNPMNLTANETVVILKVKAISPITSAENLFSIGMNSEFADATATVIEPVTLKTYGVTTGPAATDYFLSANRPNPFSTSTLIEYTMPESGKVKLSVLDMLGQEIAVLVEATQAAGSYQVEFSAAGLSTGVYLYKITVDGESRDFISTQRMVISH